MANTLTRLLHEIRSVTSERRGAFLGASCNVLAFALLLLVPLKGADAANFYVNGGCSVNGNGTAASCATSSGGAGAWNSLQSACGGPDDIVSVRGGTYYHSGMYWNIKNGCNGTPGHPLIIQNYAAETVVVDGTVNIAGSTWTSQGGGVYLCSAGTCGVSAQFPFTAWYVRTGQTQEERLNLSMNGACDASLPPGAMRYVGGRVCAHLSDGSNPGSTQYLRIPSYSSNLQMNVYKTHDVTLRKNPAGGAFRLQRARQYGITVTPQDNTNIVVDGLDIGWVVDRCVNVESVGAPRASGIQIINSHLHHCGQEGIHFADDTSTNCRFDNNEVDNIQSLPFFEQCKSTGGCPLPGFTDKGTGIRAWGMNGCSISGNYFHEVGGGLFGAAYAVDLEGHADNVMVENNLVSNMYKGNEALPTIAYFIQTQTNGPYNNIVWRNNRANAVDFCFSIDYGTSGGAGTISYLNNTCQEFRFKGYLPSWEQEPATGFVTFYNNIFSAMTTTPSNAMAVGGSTYQLPQNNLFYCPRCTGSLVSWKGTGYSASTVGNLGTGNVSGDPLLVLTGTPPSLKLQSAAGPAYQAGKALSPAFPDFEGNARPASGVWDIGADAYSASGTNPIVLPAPTNLRFQ